MKTRFFFFVLACLALSLQVGANEIIYVNREVTTHIVMPENIKMVDISTAKIVGNQCADNIVRIKPFFENDSVTNSYEEEQLLGTLTLIGERRIAQYDVVYTQHTERAASIMSHTSIRSRMSTRRFRCRKRKWCAMLGQSMASNGGFIRLCRKRMA